MTEPDVAILIPWRTDDGPRAECHRFVRAWWHEHFPEWPICYGDSASPDFHRAEARNNARAVAPDATRVLIVADADTVPNSFAIKMAVSIVRGNPQRWVLPYRIYYNLNEAATRWILDRCTPAFELPDPIEGQWDHELHDSVGGCHVLSADAWDSIGGYPTSIRTWGYEDRIWEMILNVMVSGAERLEGIVQHLHHPAPEEECFGNPEIEWNRRIAREFQRARTPRLMRSLLATHGVHPR